MSNYEESLKIERQHRAERGQRILALSQEIANELSGELVYEMAEDGYEHNSGMRSIVIKHIAGYPELSLWLSTGWNTGPNR